MKKGILVLFILLAVSCQKKFATNEYSKLNGYWEIKNVVLPNGDKKEYSINETIDFFEVKDTVGFRKKVMPQLDGSYRVNNLSEKFSIHNKDGKTFISYSTDYAKWEEELIALDDDELVVKNQHDIEYHYKKPQPFTVK
jgi:hypothetical protein